MVKRHFWAITVNQDNTTWLWRFRNRGERTTWFLNRNPDDYKIHFTTGTDPEVRRIQRRIAAGEKITFPVAID